MGAIKAFSKSTSDRLSRWISEQTLRDINEKLTALLATTTPQNEQSKTPAATFGLPEPICFDDVFFDTSCVEADIHFPTDWVLLRDAARTLMKAIILIRKHGLKQRMPQDPLKFLSEMNTLCMEMAANSHAPDSKKNRKKILRKMKALQKRIAAHARAHLKILKTRREETDLTAPQAQLIITRIENVLAQLPAAIKQAHERIIGGRRIANQDKILSLYDDQINVINRGKAGAKIEFGNKLWLGETREGIIIDYQLFENNPSDSALVKPALQRLLDRQKFSIGSIWGDRGLASKTNAELLEKLGINNGLTPPQHQRTDRQTRQPTRFPRRARTPRRHRRPHRHLQKRLPRRTAPSQRLRASEVGHRLGSPHAQPLGSRPSGRGREKAEKRSGTKSKTSKNPSSLTTKQPNKLKKGSNPEDPANPYPKTSKFSSQHRETAEKSLPPQPQIQQDLLFESTHLSTVQVLFRKIAFLGQALAIQYQNPRCAGVWKAEKHFKLVGRK